MEKKLVLIAGPTAVGKTALAIKLAAKFKTEIISADSRQVYKELTIGTAKPTSDELSEVIHHFINSHSILEKYDAARYGEEALAKIHELFLRHDVVVMCGGSGLYIKAALDGFDEIPTVPGETREYLNEQFELYGLEWLQRELDRLDPDQLKRIDAQNPMRLIRALEVKMTTGESISNFQTKPKKEHSFRVIKIGLTFDREELYKRIDQRMDDMIAAGLFQEAEKLHKHRNHQALQTVGYREIFGFMEGKYDRVEAIRLLKRNSRRYAKRQLTWFARDPEICWFNPNMQAKIFEMIEKNLG